jgi:hypothetical protein
MKRRFLLGGLGLALVGLRSFISHFATSQKGSVKKLSETSSLPVEASINGKIDSEVVLTSGVRFTLPDNPKPNQKILFKTNGDLTENSAFIFGNGNKIFGLMEDMEIDMNTQFVMTYDTQAESWKFA